VTILGLSMNERIRELAEHVVGPSRLFGGEFALMGDKQVEQFGELIVKECAQVASDWVKEPTMLSIENKIKWRFGVVE